MIPFLRWLPRVPLVVACCSILILASDSGRAAGPLATGLGEIRPVPSPAKQNFSAAPSLATAPDGTAWLTWFEGTPDGRQLMRLAGLRDGRWTPARTLAVGDSFFVNWADIGGMLPLSGGRMLVHWLWQIQPSALAYGVRLASGTTSGTLGPTVRLHSDNSGTPHGFAAIAPHGDGAAMIWIDGRYSMPGPDSLGDSQLRTAFVSRTGKVTDERVLDPRVCECCRTALVPVPGGLLAAYRGRSADEVRDIRLVRLENGKWGEPYPLFHDGWKIKGCPVNGPSLDARGARVAVAWHSSGPRFARLQVAFSQDGGRSFATPIAVDTAGALGRPRVLLLDDGSALVLWEAQRRRTCVARVARVTADGQMSPVTDVGKMERVTSGYPLMTRCGDSVLFAWVEALPGGARSVMLHQARLLSTRGESRAARQ